MGLFLCPESIIPSTPTEIVRESRISGVESRLRLLCATEPICEAHFRKKCEKQWRRIDDLFRVNPVFFRH